MPKKPEFRILTSKGAIAKTFSTKLAIAPSDVLRQHFQPESDDYTWEMVRHAGKLPKNELARKVVYLLLRDIPSKLHQRDILAYSVVDQNNSEEFLKFMVWAFEVYSENYDTAQSLPKFTQFPTFSDCTSEELEKKWHAHLVWRNGLITSSLRHKTIEYNKKMAALQKSDEIREKYQAKMEKKQRKTVTKPEIRRVTKRRKISVSKDSHAVHMSTEDFLYPLETMDGSPKYFLERIWGDLKERIPSSERKGLQEPQIPVDRLPLEFLPTYKDGVLQAFIAGTEKFDFKVWRTKVLPGAHTFVFTAVVIRTADKSVVERRQFLGHSFLPALTWLQNRAPVVPKDFVQIVNDLDVEL